MKIRELMQTTKTTNWVMITDDGQRYKVSEFDNGSRIETGITFCNGDELTDEIKRKELYKIFHNNVYGMMFKIED